MSQPLAATPSSKDVTESIIFPPGDIYSDEPPWESDLHREQIDLLICLIKWWWRDRQVNSDRLANTSVKHRNSC